MQKSGAAIALGVLFFASVAWGHEFWLAPSNYRPALHDTVTIRAFIGSGFRGEVKPFAVTRTVRFGMQGAKSVDLMKAVTNGELRWALYIPPDQGGQLLTYQSNFTLIELPAARFDAYLANEGLDAPLAARRALGERAGPGRERYARFAKTWVAGDQVQRASVPQGLPIEILPLADPVRGRRLTVQVLYVGRPLPNVLVRTWNRELANAAQPFDAAARDSVAPVEQQRTARDGRVTLDVGRDGEWLINVVHMVPSEDRAQADWQSLWASFTFARVRGARRR